MDGLRTDHSITVTCMGKSTVAQQGRVDSGQSHLGPAQPQAVLEEEVHGQQTHGGQEVEEHTQADVQSGEAYTQEGHPAPLVRVGVHLQSPLLL